MSQGYQFFGQPMHHPFGAAIKLGWNGLRQRSHLRDAHHTISFLRSWINPQLELAPVCPTRNVLAFAKFPATKVTSSFSAAMLMPIPQCKSLLAWDVAQIVAKQCTATGTGLTRRLFNCTDVGRERFSA